MTKATSLPGKENDVKKKDTHGSIKIYFKIVRSLLLS